MRAAIAREEKSSGNSNVIARARDDRLLCAELQVRYHPVKSFVWCIRGFLATFFERDGLSECKDFRLLLFWINLSTLILSLKVVSH